jgi:hypothetical protein
MRAPKRKRPMRRERVAPSPDIDLVALSQRATYRGSSEHKRTPSPAGPPRLRADATPCPPQLVDLDELTRWLRSAITAGQVGAPWDGDFPRYVWYRSDTHGCFEARLVNRESGDYKGYPLRQEEVPRWL